MCFFAAESVGKIVSDGDIVISRHNIDGSSSVGDHLSCLWSNRRCFFDVMFTKTKILIGICFAYYTPHKLSFKCLLLKDLV